MRNEIIAIYHYDGSKVEVVACYSEKKDIVPDFYDLYDNDGECLNLGEPWFDNGEGVPTYEQVKDIVYQ